MTNNAAVPQLADIAFYFDPVCLDWRFISLRMLNANIDYHAQSPAPGPNTVDR